MISIIIEMTIFKTNYRSASYNSMISTYIIVLIIVHIMETVK
jgi:hypothetical protein